MPVRIIEVEAAADPFTTYPQINASIITCTTLFNCSFDTMAVKRQYGIGRDFAIRVEWTCDCPGKAEGFG